MSSQARTALRLACGAFTPFLKPYWGDDERWLVRAWLGGGDYPDAAARLKERLEALFGPGQKAFPMSSGRAAIQLALQAADLPDGAGVIIPSFSCGSVAQAVLQAGLRPVLADIGDDFNLSLQGALSADAPDVHAIILPHLSGCWASDGGEILKWARGRGLFVVEDAAQSLGLTHGGRPAGTFGDAGVFSSGLGKPIFGPGGGWLVTAREDVASHLQSVSLPEEPRHAVNVRLKAFLMEYASGSLVGGWRRLGRAVAARRSRPAAPLACPPFTCWQIADIEAALVSQQLPKMGDMVEQRRRNAGRWHERLRALYPDGLSLLPMEENTCQKVLVSFRDEGAASRCETLKKTLFAHGVETEACYTPLHLRPEYASFRTGELANTNRLWKTVFSVPARPGMGRLDWMWINSALAACAGEREAAR